MHFFLIGSDRETWNNPAVESLLQNGYSKEMVQKALVLFRKKNGGKSKVMSLIFPYLYIIFSDFIEFSIDIFSLLIKKYQVKMI